jgi:hypothetical protein
MSTDHETGNWMTEQHTDGQLLSQEDPSRRNCRLQVPLQVCSSGYRTAWWFALGGQEECPAGTWVQVVPGAAKEE